MGYPDQMAANQTREKLSDVLPDLWRLISPHMRSIDSQCRPAMRNAIEIGRLSESKAKDLQTTLGNNRMMSSRDGSKVFLTRGGAIWIGTEFTRVTCLEACQWLELEGIEELGEMIRNVAISLMEAQRQKALSRSDSLSHSIADLAISEIISDKGRGMKITVSTPSLQSKPDDDYCIRITDAHNEEKLSVNLAAVKTIAVLFTIAKQFPSAELDFCLLGMTGQEALESINETIMNKIEAVLAASAKKQ